MTEVESGGARGSGVAPGLDLVVRRRGILHSPIVRVVLHPGDRPLVSQGDAILPGTPVAERVRDVHQVVSDLPARAAATVAAGVGDAGGADASAENDRGERDASEGAAGDASVGDRPAGEDAAGQHPAAEGGAGGAEPENEPDAAASPADPADGDSGGASPAEDGATPASPSPSIRAEIARPDAVPAPPAAGRWWVGGEEAVGFLPGRRRTRRTPGELLYETGGRWRIATGEQHERLESPVAGIVREARPGVVVSIEVAGAALPASLATGDPTRGRLELAAGADGELRAAGLDVGRTGSILVVGSRIDAETVTRARAMGIRGVIAAGISSRDLRDLAASERRQRAGIQAAAPFGVLALDGHLRRRIAGPVMAILVALAGHEVAISIDPPALVFDPDGLALPRTPPGWVRARHGEWAGREGVWLGPAGLRRFRGGAQLEAGLVRFDTSTVAVPLADLERFD